RGGGRWPGCRWVPAGDGPAPERPKGGRAGHAGPCPGNHQGGNAHRGNCCRRLARLADQRLAPPRGRDAAERRAQELEEIVPNFAVFAKEGAAGSDPVAGLHFILKSFRTPYLRKPRTLCAYSRCVLSVIYP